MSEKAKAEGRANLAAARAVRDKNREDRINRGERPTPVKKGTKAGISKDIRLQVLTALHFVGGVQYLIKQAKKSNPQGFLNLVGKCLTQEDGSADREMTFLIQQINVTAAPVPGVLNSPIAGHIAPVRLVSNGTQGPLVPEDGD